MSTKTSNNGVFQFLKSDIEGFKGLGFGVKAYTYERVGASSAFDKNKCKAKRNHTTQEVHSHHIFIHSYEELQQQTNKTSGLKIDLGFFSFGHKKEKVYNLSVHENMVIYYAQATRVGDQVQLDIGEFNKGMYDRSREFDQLGFYENYGSHFVSSLETGYFAEVLIYVECNSREEAQGVEKEMQAKISSEDGSGDVNLGSNDAFLNYCKKISASFEYRHNLPSEALKDNPVESLEDVFKVISSVQTLDVSQCNAIVSYELQSYPFTHEDTYAFINTTFEEYQDNDLLLNVQRLAKEFQKCTQQLEYCDTYYTYNSSYEEIEGIEKTKTYYEEKIACLYNMAERLNKNPWADISESYDLLTTKYNKDPEVVLIPEKLEVGNYRVYGISRGRLDFVFEKLQQENISYHVPKFTRYMPTATFDGMYIVVFYSKNYIRVPITQPDVSTKWKIKYFYEGSGARKQLVEFINSELTPWQYFYASIGSEWIDSHEAKNFICYPIESKKL